VHHRVDAHEQLDANTQAGGTFARVMEDQTGEPFTTRYDSGPPIDGLRRVLARPQFHALDAEYVRLRQQLRRPPDWFRLVGVNSRRALARAVDREWEYLAMYGEWSGFSHAADASAYIRPGRAVGEMAFLGVRSPQQMPHRAFFAAHLLLRATRQMIEHFRGGEPGLSQW